MTKYYLMKRAIFTFSLLFLSYFVFANNIQLQKVSLTDTNRAAKTVNIKMNISWEHSWRDSINWDAAWIIIKYKEPKDSLWKWKHGALSQSGNNAGSGAGYKIVVPDDRMGAFFYRSAIGSGNVASNDVKLFWDYGAAGVTNIDSVEVRVFATEMVYVPQGSYCLGDGNGSQYSAASFHLKNSLNYSVINDKWSPLINTYSSSSEYNRANDDDILYNQGIRISGINGIDINNDKVTDYLNYPTGYKSFYCMKYKVTQGQYTDFLNTIFSTDTSSSALDYFVSTNTDPNKLKAVPKALKAVWYPLADYLYSTPTDYNRNTILLDTIQIKFIVLRPDRAYGIMDIKKSLSFSDWAGLRPMSELEFEKSCRGPLPSVFYEKPWGYDSMYVQDNSNYYEPFKLSGTENGTEFFLDYNITRRNLEPSINGTVNGDGGVGPYRVGIYATDTSSRVSAQASYYGIMDLIKNTAELIIPANDAISRTLNYNINGQGVLTPFGLNYRFRNIQNNFSQTIPLSYVKSNGVTSWRGGSGAVYYGFRAVRSAPSDN